MHCDQNSNYFDVYKQPSCHSYAQYVADDPRYYVDYYKKDSHQGKPIGANDCPLCTKEQLLMSLKTNQRTMHLDDLYLNDAFYSRPPKKPHYYQQQQPTKPPTYYPRYYLHRPPESEDHRYAPEEDAESPLCVVYRPRNFSFKQSMTPSELSDHLTTSDAFPGFYYGETLPPGVVCQFCGRSGEPVMVPEKDEPSVKVDDAKSKPKPKPRKPKKKKKPKKVDAELEKDDSYVTLESEITTHVEMKSMMCDKSVETDSVPVEVVAVEAKDEQDTIKVKDISSSIFSLVIWLYAIMPNFSVF